MESAPASICPAEPIEISSGSECSPELKGTRKKGAGEKRRENQPGGKGQGKTQEAGEPECKEKRNRVSERGRGRGRQSERDRVQASTKKKGGSQKRCPASSGDAETTQDRWGGMKP